jgi:GT2 family glycosyltransferase
LQYTNTLVSIGLPVYNAASRISDVAKSVLGQDHENLELIICDNGSTDGTEEVSGRIPVNVATPRWFGGCGGCGAEEQTRRHVGGEAGVVHSADQAGGEQRRGVPDRGNQPREGDTLALRAHNPQHRR